MSEASEAAGRPPSLHPIGVANNECEVCEREGVLRPIWWEHLELLVCPRCRKRWAQIHGLTPYALC